VKFDINLKFKYQNDSTRNVPLDQVAAVSVLVRVRMTRTKTDRDIFTHTHTHTHTHCQLAINDFETQIIISLQIRVGS